MAAVDGSVCSGCYGVVVTVDICGCCGMQSLSWRVVVALVCSCSGK